MGIKLPDALSECVLPTPINEVAHSSPSSSTEDECLCKDLHENLVPSSLKVSWRDSDDPVHLHFYYISFTPIPDDREYRMFGLFTMSPLPKEAETMEIDLHLHHSRIVKTALVPSGVRTFDRDQLIHAEKFQEMSLNVILDRSIFFSDFVPLGELGPYPTSSTFYLMLPVKQQDDSDDKIVDWETVGCCLASPVFGKSVYLPNGLHSMGDTMRLRNGTFRTCDIIDSLVVTPHNKAYYFIHGINHKKNAYSYKNGKYATYEAYYTERDVHFLYPEQPFLVVKRVPNLQNLLTDRVHLKKAAKGFREYFEEFPPEVCALKIIGFSKDIGSSMTLLPSLMHHLENFLVAVELKDMLSASVPEVSEIRVDTVLQALTTQKCSYRVSLERFEVLGDAFLKYAVARHTFLSYATLDEGQLTVKRSSIVNNLNLYDLATKKKLQVYIRDELFQPSQFYAVGRPCKVVCDVDTETTVHSCIKIQNMVDGIEIIDVKCTRSHRWLSKKNIADVVESLTGAFLVESGFIAAISFLKWIGIQVNFAVLDVERECELSKKRMNLFDDTDLAAVETLLGHRFHHSGLIQQAFVHPSFNNQSGGCYQRLEFLGDAVLEYLVTSYLYSVYPVMDPGQITDLKSWIVNNKSFAYIAVGRSFHKYVRHKSIALTEAINQFARYVEITDSERDFLEEPGYRKILGDIVESCTGALLIDTGFNLKLVWKIILGLLEPALTFSNLHFNHVRELRELCQSVDLTLELPKPVKVKDGYNASVEVHVNKDPLIFSAVNRNSKAAQRMAAQEALCRLKALGFKHKRRSLQEIVQSTTKQEAELIGYNEEPILIPCTYSSTSTLLQEPEKSSEELVRDLERTLSIASPETETIPYVLPQDAENTRSKFSRDAKKSPSKSLDEAEKSRKTPINVPQDPVRTLSKLPEEVEKTPTKLPLDPKQNPSTLPQNSEGVPSKLSCQKKNEVPHTARMRLYETCAANHWERPEFVLFKEEGPNHQKMFTYKVIVHVRGISSTELECFSEPKLQKKAAQEHAAEGALWYLKHLGHSPKA